MYIFLRKYYSFGLDRKEKYLPAIHLPLHGELYGYLDTKSSFFLN